MVYYFGTTKQYGTVSAHHKRHTILCILKLEMENTTGKILISQLTRVIKLFSNVSDYRKKR